MTHYAHDDRPLLPVLPRLCFAGSSSVHVAPASTAVTAPLSTPSPGATVDMSSAPSVQLASSITGLDSSIQAIKCSRDQWDVCSVIHVEPGDIPYDVNGLVLYQIDCSRTEIMKAAKDGRNWHVWCTSRRKGFEGQRRLAKCKGSYICRRDSCSLQGNANQVQFKHVNICTICGCPGEYIPCEGRKVWEHHDNTLVVMYIGNHTCRAKRNRMSQKSLQQEIRANPGVAPSKLVLNQMTDLLSTRSNVDWGKVDKIADKFVDMKGLHNARALESEKRNPHGHSFDAVCHLKTQTDLKDKFLIYKVNNGSMNNGQPSFVFKSSKAMANIALDMDKDQEGPLQFSYAHVDGKHDRTRGMKTLTLWVEHPVLRKVLCLAVMDVEQESHKNLVLFWTILNEMLVEVSGQEGHMFNPHGWVVDENSANWTSISEVFGETAVSRTVSCEFHFKQSLVKHARKVKDPKAFKEIGAGMLEACTEQGYNEERKKMIQLSGENCGCIDTWLQWWHKRRHHIFRAFKPIDVPNTNIAEIGHAQMANSAQSQMLLIKACRIDVAQALRQHAIVEAIQKGEAPVGRGADRSTRREMLHKRQEMCAREYGKNLSGSESEENIYVPKHGSHKPPDTPKRSKRMRKSPVESPQSRRRIDLPPLTLLQREYQIGQPFVITCRSGLIRKCTGCEGDLKATHNPPKDLILRKKDYAEFYKDGKWHRPSKLVNTYYDLDMECVRRKFPLTQISDIVVYKDQTSIFKEVHIRRMHHFGIHALCDHE